MSSAISGKNGRFYANADGLDNAETIWTTGAGSSIVSQITGKVGTYAVRSTTTAAGANVLLMYHDFASNNISTWTAVVFWVRSSVNTSAGDLQLLLDNTSACASPLESMNIPALTANTWTRVLLRFATPANLTAVISVGLKQVTDLADGTFDVDDVRVIRKVAETTEWSLTFTGDTVDVTSFDSSGWHENLATLKQWNATWNVLKTAAPMSEFGTEAVVAFEENDTVGRAWVGNLIINNANETISATGAAVAYSYSGIGTGELQAPVA